ncbi:MAG TPA: DUF445 domain-containing protein [Stellaceae bacterium]|nr:DUF445 domain-containing protein [Stellaceae bacterium]
MLVLFGVCWALEPRAAWLAYPRAFAEAGLVGACADWFAVVALFRHPLGIPIPHTAILPRNKQRLADALGLFVASNFLAPAEVEARLDRIDAARWITDWLKIPENVRLIVHYSQGLLPTALEILGEQRIRGFSRDMIRRSIDSIEAAPLAGRVLSVLIQQGYDATFYDLALNWGAEFVRDNREAICDNVEANPSGWLPGWVDARFADSFISGLLDTLATAHAPNHPWRDDYRTFLQGLIRRLADDSELSERFERVKSQVLDDKLVDSYIAWLGAEAEAKLKEELASDSHVLSGALEQILLAFGRWLDGDQHMRDLVNRWTRQLVLNAIVPNRGEIGTFVTDVVVRWDTDTLVERLELQVGKDLQYIRINGTVVGGLVGLVLYVLTRVAG